MRQQVRVPEVERVCQLTDLALAFLQISLMIVVGGSRVPARLVCKARGDAHAIISGHERVATLIHSALILVRTAHVRREYAFFVCLINHAELGDEAARGAHFGTLVQLQNHAVGFVTLVAAILFQVLLLL